MPIEFKAKCCYCGKSETTDFTIQWRNGILPYKLANGWWIKPWKSPDGKKFNAVLCKECFKKPNTRPAGMPVATYKLLKTDKQTDR